MNNFHPLEIVDRVSKTRLQVGENSYEITFGPALKTMLAQRLSCLPGTGLVTCHGLGDKWMRWWPVGELRRSVASLVRKLNPTRPLQAPVIVFLANTVHWPDVRSMPGQHRRRWTNIKTVLVRVCWVFAWLWDAIRRRLNDLTFALTTISMSIRCIFAMKTCLKLSNVYREVNRK